MIRIGALVAKEERGSKGEGTLFDTAGRSREKQGVKVQGRDGGEEKEEEEEEEKEKEEKRKEEVEESDTESNENTVMF